MWENRCCNDTNIKGALLSSDPTSEDINYPPGFIGWTEDEKVYFHIGSGRWVDISASGGGGGGGGVDSINGLKGALNITADPPIKATSSGKDIKITLEEKYIKTINGINPTDAGDFTIDKTDPITITPGDNKVTVGSTGGGGGSGIQKIIIDDGELTPDASGAVTLKGEISQGTKVIVEDGNDETFRRLSNERGSGKRLFKKRRS